MISIGALYGDYAHLLTFPEYFELFISQYKRKRQEQRIKILKMLIIAWLVVGVNSIFAVESATQQPTTKPSAQVAAGSAAQKEVPLDQPNMSNIDIQVWANTAAVTVYTYDFVHYKEQLSRAVSDLHFHH